MLYSVRMRAAQGGAHEQGGRHISGAERLTEEWRTETVVAEMVARAFAHSRGQADFINLTLERVHEEEVMKVPLLPIRAIKVDDMVAGRQAALDRLLVAGVTRAAAYQGMERLIALLDSIRGAILVDASTGERLAESLFPDGIRVSRMDIEDAQQYQDLLTEWGQGNSHLSEALVLASKVAAGPGIMAELCWSDDPEYTAGYVATPTEYCRITHLKSYGSPVGGRVFFVQPGTNLAALTTYLRRQPVLVAVGGKF